MATSRTRSRKRAKDVSGQSSVRRDVRRRNSDGDDEVLEESDDREIVHFETEPAYVRVAAGVTRSLREYESLRVDVAITMPCYREDVRTTFDETRERVAEYLSEEVDTYLDR